MSKPVDKDTFPCTTFDELTAHYPRDIDSWMDAKMSQLAQLQRQLISYQMFQDKDVFTFSECTAAPKLSHYTTTKAKYNDILKLFKHRMLIWIRYDNEPKESSTKTSRRIDKECPYINFQDALDYHPGIDKKKGTLCQLHKTQQYFIENYLMDEKHMETFHTFEYDSIKHPHELKEKIVTYNVTMKFLKHELRNRFVEEIGANKPELPSMVDDTVRSDDKSYYGSGSSSDV